VRAVALAVLVGTTAIPVAADAQNAQALAQAREEFRKGIAAEAAGDWEGALTVFKGVAQVKSTPQVRFHIAQCEEKTGDFVQALGSYRLALYEAEQSKTADVQSASKAALAALEPRIPKLTLTRGAGAEVAKVVLDDRELGPNSVGSPMSVNPGGHHVVASAPGRETVTIDVTLAEKETKSVEIALPESTAESPGSVGPAKPSVSSSPDQDKPTPPPGTSPVKIAGFVVGGVGIAGLAVGGIFFGMKQSAISDLDAACGPDRKSCPADLASTRDHGETYSTVSTAAFIGGAAALAVGVTLVIAAPRRKAAQVGVSASPSGVVVGGRF